MTVFNTYSVGTAGVVNGSTTITGAGTLWSGINVRPGDDIELDGHTVVILDVVDTTHLTISPWPYASVPVSASPASPYKIIWRSPLRYAGGQAMADVDSLIASLSNPIFSGTITGPIIAGGSLAASTLTLESTSGAGTTDAIIFKTGSQLERMRIDTNGRVNIGDVGAANGTWMLQIADTALTGAVDIISNGGATATSSYLSFTKNRSTSPSGVTAVTNNDFLGFVSFRGANGTNTQQGAYIAGRIDSAGTISAASIPTCLTFGTAPNGTNSAVERMRITSGGTVTIGSATVLNQVGSADIFIAGGGNTAGGATLGTSYFFIGTYDSGGGTTNTNCYGGIANYNNDGYGEAFYIGFSKGTWSSRLKVENTNYIGGLLYTAQFNTTQSYNIAGVYCEVDGATTLGQHAPGILKLATTPNNGVLTDRITMSSTGVVKFPGISTTASAANAFLDSGSGNSLLRSTSSKRYKTNIEPVDVARMNAALEIDPIWYRSNAEHDDPEHSFYGMTAEEVAAVDPRLAHWAYAEEDWQEIEIHHGKSSHMERRLKPNAVLVPESVMYDRVAILQIAALKARIEKLERAKQEG